ncbi:MAG: DNA cytosine methyltransferase [Pseudobdellovibrionaceae bacterium]
MIGIDLFSGAGGMSLGATESGVKVVTAVEHDRWAATTHSQNFPATRVICEDIRNVKSSALLTVERREPLVVFGGPPCKGFSTSNQKTRSKDNPSNWLFLEFLRVVEDLRPEWTVFENVKGLIETEGGIFLNSIVDRLRSLGYQLRWEVLNAVDFGVPQRRSRLFIIGSLENHCNLRFPPPSSENVVTVNDAIADLPRLKVGASINVMGYRHDSPSQYAAALRGTLAATTNHLVTKNSEVVTQRYSYVPSGGNWTDIPERLMANYKDRSRCHTGIYYRLSSQEPSVVIGNFRKNMLIHPVENRGLSVREAARLQSFPDWFSFCGSIGFQQQQVGNAVPPLLAQAVFTGIQKIEQKV